MRKSKAFSVFENDMPTFVPNTFSLILVSHKFLSWQITEA